jgi:hypothetical protein
VAAREPGQYGREVLRRKAWRWLAALVALCALPLVALASGAPVWLVLIVELAVLALIAFGDRKVTPRLDGRLRGVEGEVKVGAILDGLSADGWLTVHDAWTGRGNIDHIAIGPGGIMTIETKSRRGLISSSAVSERWLAQAYAERKRLEELTGEKVDALLVLSDAYLLGKSVSRQRGVLVLPARMLAGHLARRKHLLTAEQVETAYARVVAALDAV